MKGIAILNGHFDADNPDKTLHKGEYSALFDDYEAIAATPNTHKFVINFWCEDLASEYQRIKALNIAENMTKIRYVCNVEPYYFFSLTDPDGNIIEINGNYAPKDDEF